MNYLTIYWLKQWILHIRPLYLFRKDQTDHKVHLQNSAHPLKAVLLSGVRSLLCHDHDPLIVQHRDGEHGYPAESIVFRAP